MYYVQECNRELDIGNHKKRTAVQQVLFHNLITLWLSQRQTII
jgi:hypothetical protein